MTGPYGQGPLPPFFGEAHIGMPPPAVPVSQPEAPQERQEWPSHPHAEPKRYDQILQTWTYRWWRPALGIPLVVAGFVIVVPILLIPLLIIGAATEDGSFESNLDRMLDLDQATPWSMLYLNLSIAGSILVVFLVMPWLHHMRPRWLGSVVPGLRWNLLLVFMGMAFIALIATVIVDGFLPDSSSDPPMSGKLNEFTPTAAWMLLVILLTTPLQAAGEEYVFRGYLMQAVGSFVRRPWGRWLAIFVTALVFALAHGVQNPPLFFDRFAFGFIAGWLAIRTGGLEAGIAMHVLNNYLAFGAALAFGNLDDSLTVSEISWWNIIATVTQSGVYALLCTWVARRMKLQTKTRPAVL